MAIQQKLMGAAVEHRIQLAISAALAALAAAVFSLASVGPIFATVAGFFRPLIVSTAFLLVVVAVLLRISPPSGGSFGEDLIDYVAGRPEESPIAESYHHDLEAAAEQRLEKAQRGE